MNNPLAPWLPWDFRGEPWRGGEHEYLRRTIYVSKLPEGVYLARFAELALGTVHRFLAETGELALQHAADYITDHLSGAEHSKLVLADNDTSARSLLERTVRELEERKRREGVLN